MTITPQLRRRAIAQRALNLYAEAFEANYHERLERMHAEMDPFEFRRQMRELPDDEHQALTRALDSMPGHELMATLDVAISGLSASLFKRYNMGALLRRSLCEVRSFLVDAADHLSYGELVGAREDLDEALGLISDALQRRNQVAKRAERVLVDDPHARQEVSDICSLIKQAQRGVVRSTWDRSA